MKREILWAVLSGLMALSLVLAACAPAAVQETERKITVTEQEEAAKKTPEKEAAGGQVAVKPGAEVPQYGGTLTLALSGDITGWDDVVRPPGGGVGQTYRLTNNSLWMNDWAKGIAGGYGTKEMDHFQDADIFDMKTGLVAESWKWVIDAQKDEGTIVYKIRQGIHYGLNPRSEASRLVGGRELTADDVVFSLRQRLFDTNGAYYSQGRWAQLGITVTKTGPWEVTISKIPAIDVWGFLSNLGDTRGRIVAPEVYQRYGNMGKWQNSVGTGPFMLIDYVPGSQARLERNPNYWMKDPVAPGKGNQLPYIDAVRYLILPDASTSDAALRTGKIDRSGTVSLENAANVRKYSPDLQEVLTGFGIGIPVQMKQDIPPFNDVRVRQAMLLATDFETINQSLYGGLGQILTFPVPYRKAYADVYLALDAPDMPATVRELFTYNPEKAKQLLKEAGYPNGFKTKATIIAGEVDYFAILKDMWRKVGIELVFDIKADSGIKQTVLSTANWEGVTTWGFQVIPQFDVGFVSQTGGASNRSYRSDPVIDDAFLKIKTLRRVQLDEREAMRQTRELSKYILEQAFAIPTPAGPVYTFWWPWLKNYSGENSLGTQGGAEWAAFIWIDQALKKQMGY